MKVSIDDINKRIYLLNYKDISPKINLGNTRLYTESNVFCANNAIEAIKNWQGYSENTNKAFDKALDIFSEICLNCNESCIRTCCNILLEGINKVRDANKLVNSIKHRNSRIKTKISTKIVTKTDKINSAINNTIGDIANTLNKAGASGQSNGGAVPNNGSKNDTVEECFNTMLEKASVLVEIDRIIENYTKISKRFNIDKIATNVVRENDIYQCINDITGCIDTYNIPFKNRYSAALESVYYVLNKHLISYSPANIIEAVTDYFIFSSGLSESDIRDISKIKDISVIFEQNDFDSISYLLSEASGRSNEISKLRSQLSKYNSEDLTEEVLNKYKKQYRNLSHIKISPYTNGKIYTKNGKVIAIINTETKPDGVIWIQGLEVFGDSKGNGLGKALLDVAVNDLGATHLSVRKTNTRAKCLYADYGFNTYESNNFMDFMQIRKQLNFSNPETALTESYGVNFRVLDENSLGSDLKSKTKEWVAGNPEERRDAEVHKMMDDFRSQCAKNKDSSANLPVLKSLINKIFTKSPQQIVYELPNIFGIIRASFVLVAASINPVCGVIALITNSILKNTFSRKQMEKIISAYNNEIKSVETKLEKTKDDSTKNNLEKYRDELKKDLKKIKEYEKTLYSEDENYERDMDNGDDLDLDDLDIDFDDSEFDESALSNAASIIVLSEVMQNVSETLIDDNLDGMVCNNIFKFTDDDIDLLTDFSITVPVILEKSKLCHALTEHRNQLRNSPYTINNAIRIDCLNNNIHKLSESSTSYNTTTNTKDIICYLKCISEMLTVCKCGYVNEMNFTNTLKIAINNLKRGAVKLSDKEKQMSNNIDVSVNAVSKGLETAMTNDNREAIIKGRILPSASKTIKIALGLGVAWAINPAIAVITAIGGFACSKKLKAKERQMVLDDIEIELKMCERYLKLAEDENDMKKVRQIEIMQRNLQRQQQRIKYKMKVVYNQKVPNVDSTPTSDYD